MSLFRFMLDTNMLSSAVREPLGPVARRIELRGIDRVCTSALAAAELRYGGIKSGSRKLQARIEASLAGLETLPFEPPADRVYAEIRHHLASSSQLIGPTDLFIAAHALALDLTLVTANIGEFTRVPRLRLENWLD